MAARRTDVPSSRVSRVLVANRGECALRLIAGCRAHGAAAVAVHSGAPGDTAAAPHCLAAADTVQLGTSSPTASASAVDAYLDVAAVVRAAIDKGCDAVHPGYGFISESFELADACADAGLTFIGPSASVLRLFGDKVAARAAAVRAGVPVCPGGDAPDVEAAQAVATRVGFPVLVKATGGGGGRGIRAAANASELDAAFRRCASEAKASFGVAALFVEKMVVRPRHIEVQVVGDRHGAVVAIGDRDCSVQRRHQKLVEIGPAPWLSAAAQTERGVRDKLYAAAVAVVSQGAAPPMSPSPARAGTTSVTPFVCVTTVEFLVDAASGEYYFIEANPRLQVEHTVTEEACGGAVDFVHAQLRLCEGSSLADVGLAAAPSPVGVAIQARVVSEAPGAADAPGAFVPSFGTLSAFLPPCGAGVRVETALHPGLQVTPDFDSLLAKVIVRGPTFGAAAATLCAALDATVIEGVHTNVALLRRVAALPAFVSGDMTTHFLTEHWAELVPPGAEDSRAGASWVSAYAASSGGAAALVVRGGDVLTVSSGGGSNTSSSDAAARHKTTRVEIIGLAEQTTGAIGDGERTVAVRLNVAGSHSTVVVAQRRGAGAGDGATVRACDVTAGDVPSPVAGKVTAVRVTIGGDGDGGSPSKVRRGDELAVVVVMKMETVVTAPRDGVVSAVYVRAGQIVGAGDPLVRVEGDAAGGSVGASRL